MLAARALELPLPCLSSTEAISLHRCIEFSLWASSSFPSRTFQPPVRHISGGRECVGVCVCERERGAGNSVPMVDAFFFWLVAFFLIIAVLVLLGFQLMFLADLESDFINLYEAALQINRLILPELALQGVLSLLFFLSRNWLMFMFSFPVLYCSMQLYRWQQHLIDVTEIYNLLNSEKRRRLFKLIYFVILLVLALFGMILSSTQDA